MAFRVARNGPGDLERFVVHVDGVALGRQMVARQANDTLDESSGSLDHIIEGTSGFEDQDVTTVDRAKVQADFGHHDAGFAHEKVRFH